MKKLLMLGFLLVLGCAPEKSVDATVVGKDGKDGVSIKGDKGDAGDSVKGDIGAKGDTGANGIAGTKGDKGDSVKGDVGAKGDAGVAGKDGKDGKDALPKPGLVCDVHNVPNWNGDVSLPELFVGNTTVGSFSVLQLNVPDSPSNLGFPSMPSTIRTIVGDEGYALDCAGYINVATSGFYKIKLLSDDGSELRINDQLVISNQGLHAPQTKDATVRLNKGQNRINVVYFQGPHTQIALELKWSGPNLLEQVVPAANFTN